MNGLLVGLTLITALGCGLAAGVFFAFSSFVMKALGRLSPAQGVAAMQAINVAAISFAFMVALFGTALACVAAGAWALVTWQEPFAPWLFAGSALYLVGVIVLTIAFHVPRNEALATAQPGSADAAEQWTRYLAEWTAWNHVRVAAAMAATAALTISLHLG